MSSLCTIDFPAAAVVGAVTLERNGRGGAVAPVIRNCVELLDGFPPAVVVDWNVSVTPEERLLLIGP